MEVQIIIDYRAIVKRLKTHAGAAVVFAEAVHENDDFDYGVGPKGLYLNWKPGKGDRGPITDYFSAAWSKDTTLLGYNVMTLAEVNAIKSRAKSQNGPWKTDPLWMSKKTVVRPLAKLIPHEDNTLSRMGELSDREEFNIPQDLGMLVDPTEEATPTGEENGSTIAEPKSRSAGKAKPVEGIELLSDKQLKMINAKLTSSGKTVESLKLWLDQDLGIKSRKDIPKDKVNAVVKWIDAEESTDETEFPT